MTRFLFFTIALLLAGPGLAHGQGEYAKKIAPLVDGQTVAVFHVQLDKANLGNLVKTATKFAELKPGEAAMLEIQLKLFLGAVKGAGVKEVYTVVNLDGIPQEPGFFAVPVEKEEDINKILTALKMLPGGEAELKTLVHPMKGFLIFGKKQAAQRLAKIQPAMSPQLEKALSAFPQADARLVVVVPEALRKSLSELIPALPPALGGAKTAPLLKGFQYFASGLTFNPKLTVEGTLQAADAKTAAGLRTALVHFMGLIKKEVPDQQFHPFLDKAISLLTPKVEKDQLTWNLTEDDLLPIIQPMIAKIKASAEFSVSVNNLKQIGLAMHNYHDVNKHFPTNIYDKNGKALLSWRVHLLPYVEHDALHRAFKLDEPWDSPHNKPLAEKIPQVYRLNSSKAGPNKTNYLAPFGKGLFLSGVKPLEFKHIADGSSNTIAVLEVDDDSAAIWTKPDDLVIDPKQPLKGLGGNPLNRFNALFADGSVRALHPKMLAPADFYSLLTVSGGEVIPNP